MYPSKAPHRQTNTTVSLETFGNNQNYRVKTMETAPVKFLLKIMITIICTVFIYLVVANWHHIIFLGWSHQQTCTFYSHNSTVIATIDLSRNSYPDNINTEFYYDSAFVWAETPQAPTFSVQNSKSPTVANSAPESSSSRGSTLDDEHGIIYDILEKGIANRPHYSDIYLVHLSNVFICDSTKNGTHLHNHKHAMPAGSIWIRQKFLHNLIDFEDYNKDLQAPVLMIKIYPDLNGYPDKVSTLTYKLKEQQTCYIKKNKYSLEPWTDDPNTLVVMVIVIFTGMFFIGLGFYIYRYISFSRHKFSFAAAV